MSIFELASKPVTIGVFHFDECNTSCWIGVVVAFALFVGVLTTTIFSADQVFDYPNTTPRKFLPRRMQSSYCGVSYLHLYSMQSPMPHPRLRRRLRRPPRLLPPPQRPLPAQARPPSAPRPLPRRLPLPPLPRAMPRGRPPRRAAQRAPPPPGPKRQPRRVLARRAPPPARAPPPRSPAAAAPPLPPRTRPPLPRSGGGSKSEGRRPMLLAVYVRMYVEAAAGCLCVWSAVFT
jgi:hypothetical protein